MPPVTLQTLDLINTNRKNKKKESELLNYIQHGKSWEKTEMCLASNMPWNCCVLLWHDIQLYGVVAFCCDMPYSCMVLLRSAVTWHTVVWCHFVHCTHDPDSAIMCTTHMILTVPLCALHTWSWQCHYVHYTHDPDSAITCTARMILTVPVCALHTWSWQCHYVHCTHGPGIESRWRRDFPHPSRLAMGATQPPTKCASYLFPGVKAAGGGDDHPSTSSGEVKERVQLYLYSPSGPSWPVRGWTLPLPLFQWKGFT
jgi:hypothetical protein